MFSSIDVSYEEEGRYCQFMKRFIVLMLYLPIRKVEEK